MSEGIVKLNPHSPGGEGLEPMEAIPRAFLTGPVPVQRGKAVFDKNGLAVGTWDNQGGSSTGIRPYPVFEFMVMLEGKATIFDTFGRSEVVSAGQPFFLPKGFECGWLMPTYYRKFYMYWDRPGYPAERDPDRLKAARPTLEGLRETMQESRSEAADFSTTKRERRQQLAYESADGRIQVGTWESTPYESPIAPSKRDELMCILQGRVTVIAPEGERVFQAGDSVFMPLGAPYGWRSEVPVRKVFCALWP